LIREDQIKEQDVIEETILREMSSGEDIYSNSQDHFLTGEEGSSSSFGVVDQILNMDSGNEPDTD